MKALHQKLLASLLVILSSTSLQTIYGDSLTQSGHLKITVNQPTLLTSQLNGTTFKPVKLNLPFRQHYLTGPFNAITDVKGIKVGHVTLTDSNNEEIQTGVTAIVPDGPMLTNKNGTLATTGYTSAATVLGGNGELTGLSYIKAFGWVNGPILLTNTRSVGEVYIGIHNYFEKHFPRQWHSEMPIVGECWDGYFNDINARVVKPEHALLAIENAQTGPIAQGRIGAGRGMRSFRLHAGIGSASRQLKLDDTIYTIGALVNTNHSKLRQMNPVIKAAMTEKIGDLESLKRKDAKDGIQFFQGYQSKPLKQKADEQPDASSSIVIIIATDLPLDNHQLKLLNDRTTVAIANMGSNMETNSGDFVISFSTAYPIQLGRDKPYIRHKRTVFNTDRLNPVFEAAIEAIVEAQVNAILASHS